MIVAGWPDPWDFSPRLGAPKPVLEPFAESKLEPMPEVEIDPPDDLDEGGEQE